MNLLEIIKNRYSAKEFLDREIDERDLEYILESIRLSPSSYNLQPWKIVIVKSKDMKEKLYPYSYNQRQIITSPCILVFITDLNVDRILDDLREARLAIGDDLEKVNRYLDRLRSELTSKSPESLRAYLEHQTYIALGFAILAAKERGIDSCPMGGFQEEEYRRILGLPDDTRVTVLLPLGYTDSKPIRKIRKRNVVLKRI